MAKRRSRYNLTLPAGLDADLQRLADDLDQPKSEILRRALVLFKHAVEAEDVYLGKPGEEQQRVLVR